MKTIASTDGTAIGVLSSGTGPGVEVIPGATRRAHHYAILAAALGDAYAVHAIDRRGRGPSGRQGPDYSIDREVEDAIAVLDATGSAVVFGHSYGGLVALERIIPNATLIMSPRLEHNAPDLNAPEAVAGLVRTFLTPAESMP
jgi:hypothetical protein